MDKICDRKSFKEKKKNFFPMFVQIQYYTEIRLTFSTFTLDMCSVYVRINTEN